ncbi:MAG: L-arabinose isomerase [Lentisphaerae bacterium ADurb.Bin242]|nr:MAG: L-arabinose isomerase [Lentisphaerae bacterium ADurb.Bin242]
MSEKVKIGLFGIGLNTYWGQFEGLKEKLIAYQARIAARIGDVELFNAGLVDDIDSARKASGQFAAARVELIFLYVSTYALSSTVLIVVRELNVPVIVLNLQPSRQLDYSAFNGLNDREKMTGIWLENCQACSCPEIACVFSRAKIDYHLVNGYLDDPCAWREIDEWIAAAKTASALKHSNIAVLGHYYCGMLDVYSDMTALSSAFGVHFELLEMCELAKYRDEVDNPSLQEKLREISHFFKVSPECEPYELERAARTGCALDRLFSTRKIDAMAYYYESEAGNPYQDIVTSLIPGNTLLTGTHRPVAGECEIRNAIAMKIMDLLNAGGSFSELYLSDFEDDVIYFGHDGPAHFAIAEGPVELVPVPLYHGKPGKGLSIQMTVKHGPVTLLALVHGADGEISLAAAEGESVPGPVLHIGNTNSRYRFSIGAREFLSRWCAAGPAHHCAIGVGHIAGVLEKLAEILKLRLIRIS